MKVITIKKENYNQLAFLDYNRNLDKAHVAEIKEVFEGYGVLSIPTVFEENGAFLILDGQHRISALMELGLDIQALLIDTITREQIPEVIAKLNTTAKRWTLSDYFNLYVCMEVPSFIYLDKFIKKNNLSLKTALYIHTASPLRSIMQDKHKHLDTFKKASWAPSSDKMLFAKNTMDVLNELKSCIPDIKTRTSHPFNDSLLKLVLHPKFKKGVMISNLLHESYNIHSAATHQMQFDALVSIYNRTANSRLSFDYATAIDGSIVTSEKEVQMVRDKYVDFDQFVILSPYSFGSLRTQKKLQPNKGTPDLVHLHKKYWLKNKAVKWSLTQLEANSKQMKLAPNIDKLESELLERIS